MKTHTKNSHKHKGLAVTGRQTKILSRIAYIGWLGHRNLGDEAMYQALKKYVNISPWWSRSFVHRLTRRIVGANRYYSAVCLGGGTLIFGASYSDFRCALDLGLPGWTFGTGVKDPTFWSYIPGWEVPIAEWQEVLAKCIRITVRGPRSQEILRSYGIESTVVGDPVFLEFTGNPPTLPSRPVLGLNFGWANKLLWGNNDQMVTDVMVDTALALKKDGWRIRLYCVLPSDRKIISQAITRLGVGHKSDLGTFSDSLKFMTSVQECSVFVGFKLHASLLAFCSCVPTIALEYRPKVRDFMASVDCESRCLRTDKITVEKLTAQVVEAYERGKEIQQEQENKSLGLRERLLKEIRWMNCFRK